MWESFKFKFYDYNCYSYYYYSDIYYFGPILLVVIIFQHSQYFSDIVFLSCGCLFWKKIYFVFPIDSFCNLLQFLFIPKF